MDFLKKINSLCLHLVSLIFLVFISSCRNEKVGDNSAASINDLHLDSIVSTMPVIPEVLDYDDSLWTEITPESGVVLDIRYATKDNFTKNQIYQCSRCFLRPSLADKIITLQRDIKERYNLGLKLYDCYRPRPAQQLLWDIVPDARYVTPPHKGSMHNRGLAVDLTLVDSLGRELEMGTEYDYFGERAYVTFTGLDDKIRNHRKMLTKMMELQGLKGIRTEWWHFSLKSVKAPFSDWVWECK